VDFANPDQLEIKASFETLDTKAKRLETFRKVA
jgi:hypothetical protein